MSYNHLLESVKAKLLSGIALNASITSTNVSLLDLWNLYLASAGLTTGTVQDRIAAAAKAVGLSPTQYHQSTALLTAAELSGPAGDGGWGLNLSGGAAGTVTQDASGLHFNGANNVAVGSHPVATVNGALYRVEYTVSNYVGGGVRAILYGASTGQAHTGITRSANGTYVEYMRTDKTGSFSSVVRMQVTGASGTNTLDITSISVKRVY